MPNVDWSLVSSAVTAVVAAGFALVKALSALVALFKKKV